MKKDIIKFLSCPTCHNNLTVIAHEETKERIVRGELRCKKCNRNFYIRNEIACFESCRKKQFGKDAQKLRKVTMEQEIPKKWISLFSKAELAALKKEWSFLLSVIKKNKSAIHLDFATGTGRFLRNIVSKTKGEIIALDNGYDTCQELKYFLKKIKKYKRVSIVCADARRMPFREGTFNSVSSWHGLDEPKMEDAVKEARRVLKKDDYFVASGIHYQEGSKSLKVALQEGIEFAEKDKAQQYFKELGFKDIDYKIFFEGKWDSDRDFLPKKGDYYASYGVAGRKSD